MKHRRTILLILSLALVLGLSLSACKPAATPEAEGPVVITYWHTMSDPETEQLEKVIAVFE
ncbi:MAG: hypothetical protein KAV87_47045, partial [Desulfobacteraceae bacterium]|nr:hypothetical protein [Desulfobacteraceae bacterium]